MIIKPSDLGAHFLANYKLGKYIDRGGNGVVHEVTRNHDGSIFALKCLLSDETKRGNEKRKLRFKNEIKALNELNAVGNSYVIEHIDNNTSDEGFCWYIMPLGRTILEVFRNEKVDFHNQMQFFINIVSSVKLEAPGLNTLYDPNIVSREAG